MQDPKEPFFPIRLAVLDGIGCISLGLGIAKQFAGVEFVPAQFRFENYGLAFIAGGIVLMLPALLHIIRKIKKRA